MEEGVQGDMSAMQNFPMTRQKPLSRAMRDRRDELAKTDLTKAFLSFTQAAGSLERSYAQLQAEVVRLHRELERTNTELERSLEENLRVRRDLSRGVGGFPWGGVGVEGKS